MNACKSTLRASGLSRFLNVGFLLLDDWISSIHHYHTCASKHFTLSKGSSARWKVGRWSFRWLLIFIHLQLFPQRVSGLIFSRWNQDDEHPPHVCSHAAVVSWHEINVCIRLDRLKKRKISRVIFCGTVEQIHLNPSTQPESLSTFLWELWHLEPR